MAARLKTLLPLAKNVCFNLTNIGQLTYVCFANEELDWQAHEN